MTLFTSTNGTVFDLSGGAIRIAGRQPTIPAGAMGDAIREAVQHENDMRLGRWRFPGDRDIVVVPLIDNVVAVVDERNGTSGTFTRGQWVDSDHGEAAHAYFDSHPEPRPWHIAEAGTSWRISTTGGTAVYNVVGTGGDVRFARALAVGVEELALKDPSITDAVRIYPAEEA